MDPATLKSIGSILFWGVLFFFLMRFGCGAHIMGGHGGHGGHGGDEGAGTGGTVKDPVCGMSVDPNNAPAASVYGGRTYYFCSTADRDKFEQAPTKYVATAAATESAHGGHHHG